MWVVLLVAAQAAAGEIPTASDCFNEGQVALASGSYELARERFDCARSAAPDWALAHLHWGIAQMALEPNSADTIAALTRAVALAPENPRANYYLGLALARAERWQEAAATLERSVELRAEMADAHFQLGDVRRAQGQLEAAVVSFERAVAQESGHLGALAALADLHERGGRPEEAEKYLLLIAELQPEIAYHQYNLAQFYSRIGEAHKARVAYQRAEQIDPRPKRKMRKLR